MTAFLPLAVILGVSIGVGGTYKYFKRKEKRLLKEDIKNKDSHYNYTLKSEGVKPKVIDKPKKVEEVLRDKKKDPITDPASTSKTKEKKEKEVIQDES